MSTVTKRKNVKSQDNNFEDKREDIIRESNPKSVRFGEELQLFIFLLVWGIVGFLFLWYKITSSTHFLNKVGFTNESLEVLRNLRSPSNFGWWTIPALTAVFHLYITEISVGRWDRVCSGLAFFGMDIFNEIMNSVIFHYSGYSALWTTPPKGSAFVVMVGWNIEIILMFATAGISFSKILPKDKYLKFLGIIPNRWFLAILFAGVGVAVEIWLNWAGALVWSWPFWSNQSVWPIFLWGYFHFMVVSFLVHDMSSNASRIGCVALIYVVCGILFVEFGWRRGIL